MGAAASTEAAANSLLGSLVVRNESGELTVSGPEDEEWAAYVVLSVPDGAKLDLSAGNSEISLRGVRGEFTLHTQNGPVSMVGVSGVVDCEAENGPIQYRGHAGDIRLAALSGPVIVHLSTVNGPVEIRAPKANSKKTRTI